jgi:hypothetical protein
MPTLARRFCSARRSLWGRGSLWRWGRLVRDEQRQSEQGALALLVYWYGGVLYIYRITQFSVDNNRAVEIIIKLEKTRGIENGKNLCVD